jgi:glycosyltransferase involved in cell wall biosynthesis
MRIIFVNSQDLGGGAAVFMRQLAGGLRARGHDVTLLVGIKKTDLPWVREIPVFGSGGSVEKILRFVFRKFGRGRMTEVRSRYLARRLLHLREWRGAMARRRGFEDFRLPGTRRIMAELGAEADIIHLNNLHYFVGPTHFDVHALRQVGRQTRIVYTLHDTWAFTGHCAYFFSCQRWQEQCGSCPHLDVYPALRRDESAANLRTKATLYREIGLTLTTPSQWLMSAAQQSILAPAIRHSEVIPHGLDLEFFRPTLDRETGRAFLGIAPEEKVICFVADNGRATQWRDYGFVENLARAFGQKNPGQRLVVIEVGGEPYRKSAENVRFIGTGRLDAAGVRRIFQAADLMVYPAKADNFPYVILEAQACGAPVLASRVGGIPEQLEEGRSGELFALGNLPEALRHLESLLADAPRLARMRTAAREHVVRAFALERMVDDYERLYREISAGPNQAPLSGASHGHG